MNPARGETVNEFFKRVLSKKQPARLQKALATNNPSDVYVELEMQIIGDMILEAARLNSLDEGSTNV